MTWLVRQHLLMSITAQRQDIGDPIVVNGFAQRVGDPGYLDYLYLLTLADISGTSPKLTGATASNAIWRFLAPAQLFGKDFSAARGRVAAWPNAMDAANAAANDVLLITVHRHARCDFTTRVRKMMTLKAIMSGMGPGCVKTPVNTTKWRVSGQFFYSVL